MSSPVSCQRSDADGEPAGRWWALLTLAIAMVLAMSTWFSASAVVPQLRGELQLSGSASAWLTICVQLGFVVGAVLSAALNLADRVGPRRLMLLGSLGAAAANSSLLLDLPLVAVLLARAATGASLALVYPAGLKAMATWFRTGRGLALGVMVGALTLGSASPHLVNSLGGLDWRTVIWATSAATVLGGVIAQAIARDGPLAFARGSFDPARALALVRVRALRLVTVGYLGHMWELYAMWAWLVVFFQATLVDSRALSATGAAALTFAVIGVGAAGCWLGGVAGDRWGRTRLTSAAMVASAACAAVVGVAVERAPLSIAIAIALVWGVAVIADSAQFSTMMTELADQESVGTVLTAQLAAGFLLTAATIWLIPVAVEIVGWTWAFAVLVPGPALGVVAMQLLARSPDAARIANGRG